MKLRDGIICLAVLFVAGLLTTPALGSTLQASYHIKSATKNLDTITVDFVDCTGVLPIKKEITLSKEEWRSLQSEFRTIRLSDNSFNEQMNAQLAVLKKHHFISNDATIAPLMNQFIKKVQRTQLPGIFSKKSTTPIINNSIFNAMCGINFEFTNGTTYVFGLNTFINIIGFDIISVHKGYTPDGIQTTGILTRSTTAGTFIGGMFGFLGYWFGTKTGTGSYSDIVVAGFTIVTVWLPIS
jgi:hypothetical protein